MDGRTPVRRFFGSLDTVTATLRFEHDGLAGTVETARQSAGERTGVAARESSLSRLVAPR
jgi:hypothetical protein